MTPGPIRRARPRSTAAACTGLALALTLTSGTLAAEPEPRSDGRPDIVVFYLDDVAPHDGRLWDDPTRTPNLAALFVEDGVTFTSAVVETPLCSPGRAGFLTGRHTSAHGVDGNEVGVFDPSVTVGTELQDVGYRTLYVGKYLNGLRSEVPRRRVGDYAAGWDEFDVIYGNNGRYLDYRLWTRDGVKRVPQRPPNHSTLVTKRRVLTHLAETPTDRPVFAMISPFDLHAPNRVPARFRGHRRCRDIEPWAPPTLKEDVADKPAYVRRRPPLPTDTISMRTYCEQMLAVDELAGAVVAEQRRRDRLDDTLFVFTADNGSTWGGQRMRQRKGVPYATPVPLMFSWPARWSGGLRTIDELVSNIDLAPTLCAVAGCEMGPFANGDGADGLDLLPLLDGDAATLPRTVVREQSGPDYRWAPEFWAVRTSGSYPLGRWHYVEYETGEVELYHSATDPWELENRATDPDYAGVTEALARELRRHFPDRRPIGVQGRRGR